MSTPALSTTERETQSGFNAFHTARASADLVARLYAEAMGDAYPAEVDPSSSCDWTVLGTMVTRLRMRPGQVLVDMGCGTGGVGLWLSRALSVHLVGIDISSTAIELAAARRAALMPPSRAAFRVGTLEASGLDDGTAHGVVCVDAMGFAEDQTAALREIHRILHPGAHAVLTRGLRRDAGTAWRERAESAGFEVEHVDERPGEPQMWRRLYRRWIAHDADLRRVLGNAQAENMLREATWMLPRLDGRRAVVVTLRRPEPLRTVPPLLAPPDSVHTKSIAEEEER